MIPTRVCLFLAITLSGMLTMRVLTVAPLQASNATALQRYNTPLFGAVSASRAHRSLDSAALKSLALRLADVQHVYGSAHVTATVGTTRKSTDIACSNASTVSFSNSFGSDNGAPVPGSGVLNIAGVLTQYRTSAGPHCNFAYDLAQRKTLGATLGIVTRLSGVGDQAVLIRLDPMKHDPGSPVYTLTARFIRGRYLVIIVVQVNKKVHPGDVTRLAQDVDSRIKRSG